MIRPSALNLVQHCRMSAELAKHYQHENEDAEHGTEVHAQVRALGMGQDPGPLLPDARAIIQWINDTFPESDVLAFEQEIRVIDPDTGALVTKGTADLVVRHELGRGACGATVVDFKKNGQRFAGLLPSIEDDLQTDAYAIGWCQALGAIGFRKCYLWYGDGEVDAEWSALHGPDELDIRLQQIRALDFKPRVYTTGAHCGKCYARLHCSAWMLPAYLGEGALAPYAENGLTLQSAPQLLRILDTVESACELMRKNVQELARRSGGIADGDRRYGIVKMPGKRSANMKAIEAAGPEAIQQFTKVGAPFEQFRWMKNREASK